MDIGTRVAPRHFTPAGYDKGTVEGFAGSVKVHGRWIKQVNVRWDGEPSQTYAERMNDIHALSPL